MAKSLAYHEYYIVYEDIPGIANICNWLPLFANYFAHTVLRVSAFSLLFVYFPAQASALIIVQFLCSLALRHVCFRLALDSHISWNHIWAMHHLASSETKEDCSHRD